MNPGTLTLPSKTVSIRLGAGAATSVLINPALIQSVVANGSGSKGRVFFGDSSLLDFTSADSPSTLLSGLPYIAVTIIAYGTTTLTYVPTSMMAARFATPTGSGTTILMLTNQSGREYQPVEVTESPATVEAAYAIVAATVPGATIESVTAAGTTQGTATATTANNINITAGGAGRGITLTAATVGERAWVKELTGAAKRVYPASAGFIDERAVNIPFDLPAYGAIELICTVAGKWNVARTENVVTVVGVGTTNATTALIPEGTDTAIVTTAVLQTAAKLPLALPGKKIRVVFPSAATGRLFPTIGEQIGTLGVDAVLTVTTGRIVELFCATAGTWLFSGSRVQALTADSITTSTITEAVNGGDLAFNKAGGTPYFVGKANSVEYSVGVKFNQLSVTAVAGGQGTATQLLGNVINIEVVAVPNDGVLLLSSISNYWIKNSDTNAANVYGETGYSIDGGTVDEPVSIPANSTMAFFLIPGTLNWKSQLVESELVTRVTLVAGQGVVNAAGGAGAVAIGTRVASITADSYVQVLGVTALNGPTAVSVNFISTAVAGTSITIDGYDAAGVAAADVTTVRIRIVF